MFFDIEGKMTLSETERTSETIWVDGTPFADTSLGVPFLDSHLKPVVGHYMTPRVKLTGIH